MKSPQRIKPANVLHLEELESRQMLSATADIVVLIDSSASSGGEPTTRF